MSGRRKKVDVTEEDIVEAVEELQSLIRAGYPDAEFRNSYGDDPWGFYVNTIVDVEDIEEVYDLVADRLLDMQVERYLPIYVSVVRPEERILEELDKRLRKYGRRSGGAAVGP